MSGPYSPALDGSLGALEIGTVVGTFFFGILTLQTFNYYRQFPDDSKTLKITVTVLWLLELAQTNVLFRGKIYVITVTFYGQPPSEVILKPPQSQVATILFSGGIDGLVQVRAGADSTRGV
ncbi:hypothetical protein C8R44DRAFT_880903 [Mycena epipterygia]|nr:hypothetical protein C8R44DRAFT_880903 [Mycena epipterygia]